MGLRLLIIDDNEGDAVLIKEIISEAGTDIEAIKDARTGEEGLALAEEFKPTAALIDTHMPGIDGFETCRRMKELLGESVKVIIMTGLIDAVDAVKARKMGADDYCVKTADCASVKKCLESL